MVESVDDLKSSRSIKGTHRPGLWVARRENCFSTEQNHPEYPPSRKRSVWRKWKLLKKTVSFEEDRLLTWSTNTSGVTGTNDSVENYADLFTVVLRNDNIQDFDRKSDEIRWQKSRMMTSWKNLFKLRIRESDKLKTVLELYNMEIHQKKAEPDYHRLKTMVTRSIEQNLRMKNFEVRNGNFETSAVVKNQRVRTAWTQKSRRLLAIGKLTGSVRKETIAVSDTIRISVQNRHSRTLLQDLPRSRMWKKHREPRVLEAEVQVGKWLDCRARDYLKGTCTTPFCEKWHPPECLFYKSENRCRFGEKLSYAHRQVDEQPGSDTKWDEIRWHQIPSDDILENLFKLRIRESDKLKTVLELYQYWDPSEESRTWLSQIEDDR